MCRGLRIKEIVRRLKIIYENETPLNVIKDRNIVVCYLDESCVSKGAYEKIFGTQFIYINTKLCDYESRMTYAHELGHSILHPDVDTFILKKTDNILLKKYEKEADIFAAEFLIDDDVLSRYPGKTKGEIAKEERVSLYLLELKLSNLFKSNKLEEHTFDVYYAI